MKKIIYVKMSLILLLAVTLTSCGDEFLEQSNPNNISTTTFWKNVDDLNTGLISTYKALSSPNNIALVDELSRSDLAWASGFQRPNNTNPYYLQIFNDAAQVPNQKWAENYRTIFRANQVILGAEELIGTFESETEEEEALIILAQARFIRGYMYFNLYNNFNGGSVPIFDFVPEEEEDFYQSLRPASEVKEFYLADLDFASKNLPTSWEGKEKGRVTAGAAVAVIGQSYLYEGNYSEASVYFKRVIDDYGYSLTPNIGSNFTTMDELNEESILEVVYSTDYKNELGPWDSRDVSNAAYNKRLTGGPGSWWGGVCANWLILEYRNDPMDLSDPRNKYIDQDGNEVFRKFSLRTSWSVALVDDEAIGYYGKAITGQASNFNVKMTAFWRKHTNWDLGESEDALSPGKVRSGVNERLIRLGEIFLQYAECQIELGNVDEALLYINKIRRRSALMLLGPAGSGEYPTNDHDNITYDATSLMEHLRYKEYPLELSCEGDGNRNIDLRRWGVKKQRFQELAIRRYAADNHVVKLENGNNATRWGSIVKELPLGDAGIDANWNEFQEAAENYDEDSHSYWPIPNSEVIANPALYE